jgi:hypothetical protein
VTQNASDLLFHDTVEKCMAKNRVEIATVFQNSDSFATHFSIAQLNKTVVPELELVAPKSRYNCTLPCGLVPIVDDHSYSAPFVQQGFAGTFVTKASFRYCQFRPGRHVSLKYIFR